ncbi:hypothetical protein [Nostoc sp. UHCC 0870]|uniref:hypothetical protein n=1 Tax=Nostoc sp. UHCC 0870 TaxID=2914041 RepID=UPI001EDFF715|nr:hypothetical protein [Nostoc sp. UHCC 0870]UKO99508.1 hypothetical protein L6494_07295 [Nostoc sp. UHCC 0870]
MFTTKLLLLSEQPTKFLRGKEITLREKQDRTLEADVKSVLSYKAWINAKTNNLLDNTRILSIVASAKGAENYLPYTIPKIIQQISEIGMKADIVIGLNNGFECPTVIKGLTSLSDVQVIHLYTGDKVANNIPAIIFDNSMCKGKPYCITNIKSHQSRHRIFVVHQKQGEHAAGKIRVLGDIYGSLLLESINNGWIPPAILIAFDAESQFLVEHKPSSIELDSNGLSVIVNQLKKYPQIDILGTRNKFAVYQKSMFNGVDILLPNLAEQVPPIQWFIDISHGKFSGFKYHPGGGTFGKTDVMVSLLLLISEKYPGVRCEDTQLSVLAHYAGFISDIFLDVISINRSPSMDEMTNDQTPKKAWIEQIYRWLVSIYGLKIVYGEHNVKRFANSGFPLFILTNPLVFLKSVMENEKIQLYTVIKKIRFLLIAFLTFQQILKKSRKHPDILQGNKTKAYW